MTDVRIDRWLWAARFFKTRRLASESVKAGHVQWQGERCKAAKAIHIGDFLRIQRGQESYEVQVLALADKRGSASIAQSLYEETATSLKLRQQLAEQRRNHTASAPAPNKRPDKKARRQLIRFKSKA